MDRTNEHGSKNHLLVPPNKGRERGFTIDVTQGLNKDKINGKKKPMITKKNLNNEK